MLDVHLILHPVSMIYFKTFLSLVKNNCPTKHLTVSNDILIAVDVAYKVVLAHHMP